ncbi:MAG: FKBP-type peptidyl-prolyl cis-trans isomerase [Bacteroidales bacterium]|nr:FKBP-type peptidyl-prolyl cis-trans isomerase [Bacteroidales bacterium]
METIAKGKYVALAYKIYVVGTEQDVPVFEFTNQHPDAFVFGHDMSMIEGFMKNIDGLQEGAKFDFTLAPAEAFGEKDQNMIIPIEKDIFKNGDGEFDNERVQLGNYVPMMTAGGQRVEGLVIEITDTHVTLDFNHQLAGESVRYEGEVLVVRDATEAELNPHQGCGSCSGCGDGGGCSGCSGCH